MSGKKINLQTAKKTVPMIYAYTTPEIRRHDGWVKIGYTEKDVEKRIDQQTKTVDVIYKEEWRRTAIYDDGSGDCFRDTDFHAYLRAKGVESDRSKDNEWFHISGQEAERLLAEFKSNRGLAENVHETIPYVLRREQADAVGKALDYFKLHERGEYLWNAKPRFGKTLSVYDLCKKLDARKVLIVTNRPAIANSWYDDYAKFIGREAGYFFVSTVDAIRERPGVISLSQYKDDEKRRERDGYEPVKMICFLSLQDLKGSVYFGGKFDKLREVSTTMWDVLVIDEAHEGVDTYKTDVAFDKIKRLHTLHLSGTPFKALANDKFSSDAIFNWTYADEQKAKRDWPKDRENDNPYKNLPQLNMFTYRMSEIVRDEIARGTEIDGVNTEFAFDLNDFFATNDSGRFIHNDEVNCFLEAMTKQEKFPFSTEELRCELRHTLWMLNRVESAKALARKLEKHPLFGQYKIVLAAGDGRMDDEEEVAKAYDRVVRAIQEYDRTITLTVGQLTTGVTVPEWSAVFMLSSIKSPSLYMQAAFRAQNPCLFSQGGKYFRKQNAYVFDFDPARTLIVFEKFANDLSDDTSSGKGDRETREKHIKELLNFFPVIGEDENGEMILLDAEKVLSIPRKIKSIEVVRRGFMCDYLFQNISNIFHAPQEVIDIITAIKPSKDISELTTTSGAELSLSSHGNVELDREIVIGTAAELFGEKIFSEAADNVEEMLDGIRADSGERENRDCLDRLLESFEATVNSKVMETAETKYGSDLTEATKRSLQRSMRSDADVMLTRAVNELRIDRATLDAEMNEQLEAAHSSKHEEIRKKFEAKKEHLTDAFKAGVAKSVEELVKKAGEEVVRRVETDKREAKKRTIEDKIRDHLRGFSRTIPSFLMAYGKEGQTTLENFDRIVPDDVFIEVTSISLAQFCLLRDGGSYTNPETGAEEWFGGNLFDPVVFNDSVNEFMMLKKRLADYFDENVREDIFDYIPNQKTNQIFTPKKVVIDMVERLEKENPGCFDDPDKTFADLYMKSGMYIAEIVKRLYNSTGLKRVFPDDKQRIRHIFANQVYGLAPTEIIYRITLSYILGFTDKIRIDRHNIRLCDALVYAKEGSLEDKLNELYEFNQAE